MRAFCTDLRVLKPDPLDTVVNFPDKSYCKPTLHVPLGMWVGFLTLRYMYRSPIFWFFCDVLVINIVFLISLLLVVKKVCSLLCVTKFFYGSSRVWHSSFLMLLIFYYFWVFGRAMWLLKEILLELQISTERLLHNCNLSNEKVKKIYSVC